MNYRRGLLRLWLIASVLWIACVGWLYASEAALDLDHGGSVTRFSHREK